MNFDDILNVDESKLAKKGQNCFSSAQTRRNEQSHNYRQPADVRKNPSNVCKIKDDGKW